MNNFELRAITEAASLIERMRDLLLANGLTLENAALTGEADARAKILGNIVSAHRETA
ncbi:hypothetical protein CBA19CS22_38070 [Caballeronia novacaledonica]|uniref:Uncharacterized protein n=1 Tax=Caballeronia novacaledonica TaxID=1544861 RepID=A0ACB5R5X8_9BURK|nr:hypothetical protein CBA19CS22_38070 [Caballeronia novacaledonica]